MAPSRASAERRGVKLPKCRGASPTTIIAKTGFKFSSRKTITVFADFVSALILAVFPNPANRLANGANEVAPCYGGNTSDALAQGPPTPREISFCVKELTG
jgi:hypothetical protein